MSNDRPSANERVHEYSEREGHPRLEDYMNAHGGGAEDTHAHSHGGVEHTHSHDGGVPHIHSSKKAVISRLRRAYGHLDSVIRMVEDDRDCSEVLIQLAAVRSALNNAGKVILQDHITECITEAVFHNDSKKIDELNRAIAQFIK